MKRLIAMVLALVMALSLVACGGGSDHNFLEEIWEKRGDFSIADAKNDYSAIRDKEYDQHYTYKSSDVDFFGYSGTADFTFVKKTYYKGMVLNQYTEDDAPLDSVSWSVNANSLDRSEYEKMIKTFVKKFDKAYGEHVEDGAYYKWYDAYRSIRFTMSTIGGIAIDIDW